MEGQVFSSLPHLSVCCVLYCVQQLTFARGLLLLCLDEAAAAVDGVSARVPPISQLAFAKLAIANFSRNSIKSPACAVQLSPTSFLFFVQISRHANLARSVSLVVLPREKALVVSVVVLRVPYITTAPSAPLFFNRRSLDELSGKLNERKTSAD